VQVHDHDVRSRFADDPERLCAGRGLADDRDTLLLEQVAETGAEEVVVVDEKDADAAFFDVPYRFALAQKAAPYRRSERAKCRRSQLSGA